MTEEKEKVLLGKDPLKPVGKTPEDERKEKAKKTLESAQGILKEHGNQESNIPITNIYWQLMNEFRALSRPTP